MAMKILRWMKEPIVLDRQEPNTDIDCSEHGFAHWPRNSRKETSVLLLRELQEHIQTDRSSQCKVDRYVGVPGSDDHAPYWQFESKAESPAALQALLVRDGVARSEAKEDDAPLSTFYLAKHRSAQATQLLGYYLNLPPRFFDPSYVVYSISPKSESSYVYFKVQFVEIKTMDLEHTDTSTPTIAFKDRSEWRFTDVALICASRQRPNEYDAVCVLNQEDDTIAEALHRLLSMANEGRVKPSNSNVALVFDLINEGFRMIALNWGFFLDDAEAHVADISSQCVGSGKLSTEDKLRFTRELHQLTPVWGQVSRRLSAARNVIDAVREHPFYNNATNLEEDCESLLKIRSTVEEHLERTEALRERTEALISLVLNIALLNESTATMAESRASNDLALKVHRITIITFIFFPLSISMSAFGMNVRQMTGNQANPDISAFVTLAIGLILFTALLWLLWYLLGRRRRNAIAESTC